MIGYCESGRFEWSGLWLLVLPSGHFRRGAAKLNLRLRGCSFNPNSRVCSSDSLSFGGVFASIQSCRIFFSHTKFKSAFKLKVKPRAVSVRESRILQGSFGTGSPNSLVLLDPFLLVKNVKVGGPDQASLLCIPPLKS